MTTLRIPSPCHESWDAMIPNREGRHCAACDKTVIDVTAMAPVAAREYVGQELPMRVNRGERVCVRAHADRSGRLLRPGVTRRLLTNGLAAVLAMAMADYVGGPGLAAAEGGTEPQVTEPVQPRQGELMPAMAGGICAPEPAIAPVVDAATGLTITVDSAAFQLTATRPDKTAAWTIALPAAGIPSDTRRPISGLAIEGVHVVVGYGVGPDGKPVERWFAIATGTEANRM